VADPAALERDLTPLRMELLADPYLKRIPSVLRARRKTALAFHTKDDPPEVRYRVFQALMAHDVRLAAVIRDKNRVVVDVRARNAIDLHYRDRENNLYDALVSHLFKSGFHEADHFKMLFTRRGEKDRTAALQQALEHARLAYERNFGVASRHTAKVIPSSPRENAAL